MAGILIEITVENHGGESAIRPSYRAINATIDGVSKLTDLGGINPIEFIGNSVQEVVKASIANETAPADVTVNLPNEIVLTAGTQTRLVDKYEVDPSINTLTFA